ncbi:cache domain-containing protein [Pseudodesulfovibrio indicus]|uniref:Cache domain-containing protein n=1 Tax=Pseudodesulfovibrio indicus TaxID=1716143 RepID=A0A126QLF4_9BACT|nr:cache domain-containing protein [Pseudodesulfovibrio indicus]AMK10893.1 hypothetical protein AWY79_07115 [Pseudodesulfovibrio indicus]TDT91886.1 hypothetical protein EDC59_101289 [Pseudodesulfovibrio indicus]
MKTTILVCALLVLTLTAGLALADRAPQTVYDLSGTLAAIGSDPVIVEAVKAQNAKGMKLSEIQAMDERWRNTYDTADFMLALMTSELGKHLLEILKSKGYCTNIFVMDNQGALVGMVDKVSNYWIGDREIFKASFSHGAGAVFAGEVDYDDTDLAYKCPVSVPVVDGEKAIGVITFIINIDELEM